MFNLLIPQGGGGGGTWGSITGTLSNQTDLQTALDLKAPLSNPIFTTNVTATCHIGASSDGVYNLGTLDGTGGDSKRFNKAYVKKNVLAGTFGTIGPVIDMNDTGFFCGGNSDGNMYPNFTAALASAVGEVALFQTRTCRGTLASPTTVKNTDYLGQWQMAGYTNGAYHQAFQLYTRCTQDWTAGAQGVEVYLQTTKNGDSGYQARLYWDTSGNTQCKNGIFIATDGGVRTKVSTADVSVVPTQAEMVSAFGTAASTGAGWIGVINDNNADTAVWMVVSDATSYFYGTLTKGA